MRLDGQPREKEVLDRWVEAGQGHVLRFWESLGPQERSQLLEQLEKVPLDLVDRLVRTNLASESTPAGAGTPPGLEPCPFIPVPISEGERAKAALRRELGERAIREGRTAALMVAGGDGTRLGWDAPKGTMPITPIRKKSLFQLHAEQLRALSERYDRPIPLFVMTSSKNHEDTTRYFRDHAWFGLDASSVHFFAQANLPAVDLAGRILLESPSRIAESPNGHGGVVDALLRSGALARMDSLGVEEVFYFQVDNPLVRILDPVFLGHHIHQGARISTKIVRKRDAAERVGVLVNSGGAVHVVEYTDLAPEIANARSPEGALVHEAGSIAVHIFQRDFLERAAGGQIDLPYHMARKIVPAVGDPGDSTPPSRPNAVKFERFVFDLFPHAGRVVVLEASRPEEFAPVKNKDGVDSSSVATRALIERAGRWLERAGIEVPRDLEGRVNVAIEIGPRFALDEAELARRIERPLRFEGGELLLDVEE